MLTKHSRGTEMFLSPKNNEMQSNGLFYLKMTYNLIRIKLIMINLTIIK